FQNSVSFGQALGKTGQEPGFSIKSKEAVPKTEVLEQPQLASIRVIRRLSSLLSNLMLWTDTI
ncbi:MAG: hypothetical protein LBS57_03475, partial [Treponema sp.]|nr:hypothetical protein [Treponema sp.]